MKFCGLPSSKGDQRSVMLNMSISTEARGVFKTDAVSMPDLVYRA